MSYGTPSPFPPSFEGNPWAYGFGLFGDVVAASLSLAVLLAYAFEARRNREVSDYVRNMVVEPPLPRWSPLFVYRLGKMSMLAFIVMRALPDALWMLAWGEVSEWTIRFLLAFDLWMDGMALFPLMMAIICWAWGRQIIPQKLIEGNAGVIAGRLPWGMIANNAKIVLVVLLIAVGVTIGKAGA